MRISKRSLTTLLAGLGCALSLASVSGTAEADVMPGNAGFGWPNAVKNCFQASYGAIVGQYDNYDDNGSLCADRNLTYVLPVPVASGGTKTLSVRAYGAEYGAGFGVYMSCKGIATSSSGGGSFSSSAVTTGTSASYQTLSLGTLYVASTSSLQFECTMRNASSSLGKVGARLVSGTW